MEPIFKYCACGNKIASTDTHSECMYCLTLDHDSTNCSSCHKLKPKALKERTLKLHAFLHKEKVRRRAQKELRHKKQPSTGVATTSSSSIVFNEAMLQNTKEVPKTTDTLSEKEATTSTCEVTSVEVTSVKATSKKHSGKKKHVTEVTKTLSTAEVPVIPTAKSKHVFEVTDTANVTDTGYKKQISEVITTPSTVKVPITNVKIVSAKHILPVQSVENVEKVFHVTPKSVSREVPKMAIPPEQQLHQSSSTQSSKKTPDDLQPVDTQIKSGDKQWGSSGQTQTSVLISAQPPSETQGSLPIAGASLESVTSQDVLVPAGPAEHSSKSLPSTPIRRRMSRSQTPTEEAEAVRHRHTSLASSHHSSIRDHRSEARSVMSGHFSSDQVSTRSHADSRRHGYRSRSSRSSRRHSSIHLSPHMWERSRSSQRHSSRRRGEQSQSARRRGQRRHSAQSTEQRSRSPRHHEERSHSARRHEERSHSPRHHEERSHSARRHEERSHSARRHEERSHSARRHEERSHSARRHEERSQSHRRREDTGSEDTVFSSTGLSKEEHRRREARRHGTRRHESRSRSSRRHASRSQSTTHHSQEKEEDRRREHRRRASRSTSTSAKEDSSHAAEKQPSHEMITSFKDWLQITTGQSGRPSTSQKTPHTSDRLTSQIHAKLSQQEKHRIFCSMFDTDEDMETFLDTLENDAITVFKRNITTSSTQVPTKERDVIRQYNEESEQSEEDKVRSQSPPDDILTYGTIIMEIAKKHNIPRQVSDYPMGVLGGMIAPPIDTFTTSVPLDEMIETPLQEMFKAPTKVPSTLQRQDKKYCPAQADKNFLKQHPNPDQVILEAVKKVNQQAIKGTSILADPDGRRMDHIGKRMYSSASTAIRCANAQAYMSRHQFDIFDHQNIVLNEITPENLKDKIPQLKKTVEKGKLTAVQQLRIAKDSADLAGRSMTTAIVARRQAWAKLTDFRPEVQTAIVSLPFDGDSLFGGQLQPVLSQYEDIY